MRRLLAVLILALAAVPAQAQSTAAVKWHGSHPFWMLRGDIVSAAGVVRPGAGAGGSAGGASTVAMFDDTEITFGTGTDAGIAYNTVQTPDSWYFGVGQDSRCLIIAERADRAFDFAHAIETNPCLIVHSAAQSTTQWIKLLHDGTNAVLDAGTGFFRLNYAGVWRQAFSSSSFAQTAPGSIGFSSATNLTDSSVDTFFTREAAATMQMGADVNGAAVAQSLKAPDAITGSNVKGGDFTLASGRGTGNAAASSFHIQVPSMLATGTTAQVLADRFVACETKTLSNTTATTTNIASVALASNSGGGVRISVSVRCDDGTNFDSDVVTSYVAFVNKAGALTIGTAVTTASAAANNSGSCTVAPTFTAGTNSVDINVTPVIGTITPTTTTAAVNIENFGVGAVTCK